MDNKYIKIVISVLVVAITTAAVVLIANMNKTYSRIEVIETPRYEISPVGGFIIDPFYTNTDQNSNMYRETPDGGWIVSQQNRQYGQYFNQIAKYSANGTLEWAKEINPDIYGTGMLAHLPDSTTKEYFYGKLSGIEPSGIYVAPDGGYYVNFEQNEGIFVKLDSEGNILWQNDYSNYHAERYYTDTCEGVPDENGKVTKYRINSTTHEITNTYQEELYSAEIIDSSHYYCKHYDDYDTRYNRYYNNGGFLAPLNDGGVALLTANTDGSYGKWRLDDGTFINSQGHYKFLIIYDKNGKAKQVIDVYDLYNASNEAYKTRYNITSSKSPVYDTYVYHDYIGAYKNDDLLLIAQPAKAAIKLHKNETTGQYETLWFTPIGFNGYHIKDEYIPSNGEGLLNVQIFDDGGFTIKPYSNSYITKETSSDPWYDIPNLRINQFEDIRYDGEMDYVRYAMYIARYGEKTETDGTKQAYLTKMTPVQTTERSEANVNGGGHDVERIYNGNSNTGYYTFDDGSYLVVMYITSFYGEMYNYVILEDGTRVEFANEKSYIVARIRGDYSIVWAKQFVGAGESFSGNPFIRINEKSRKALIPVTVGPNSSLREYGSDEAIITNTTSSSKRALMIVDLLYDREERVIPDPTTEATTEATTGGSTNPTTGGTTKKQGTTKKKTTKEIDGTTEKTTEEVTTEETTEETSTTSSTTKKKTTTANGEVKGDDTNNKGNLGKIAAIIGIVIGGLFVGGVGFYFIPIIIVGRKKVLIGLSGNVDSAVAAKLLLDKNYKVSALFINNGTNVGQLTYAKQICNKLGIDLYEQDINETYKSNIKQGIANHPDANLDNIYNKYVLIDMLKEVAKEQRIGKIAIGVYAKKQGGVIAPGANQVFDESSKLSLLTEDDIKKLLLPLGDIDYQEVGKIAEQNGLGLSNAKQTAEDKIGKNNL